MRRPYWSNEKALCWLGRHVRLNEALEFEVQVCARGGPISGHQWYTPDAGYTMQKPLSFGGGGASLELSDSKVYEP